MKQLPSGTEGCYFALNFGTIGANLTNKASEILSECMGPQSAMDRQTSVTTCRAVPSPLKMFFIRGQNIWGLSISQIY